MKHTILVCNYASYHAADCATTKFIRSATDEIWYQDLHHTHSFYINAMAKQLLDHLNANCRGLHPSKVVNLPTGMMGYYSDDDGIPKYINDIMLKEAQCKLACAKLPTFDDQNRTT